MADTASLSMLARAADGSLRDALSLLDHAVAHCGGELREDLVAAMLGTIERGHVAKLLKLLAAGDAAGLLDAVAGIDEQAPDYVRLLDDLARLLQRVAVYQAAGVSDTEDELAESELRGFADAVSGEDLQLFYQMALLGKRDLHLAPDPKSGVEMTLLRMLAFQPQTGSSGRAAGGGQANAARPSRQAAPAPAPVPAPAPRAEARTSAVPVATPWQVPDWARLIPELELNGAAKLLAANCAYLRRNGDLISLELDSRSESLLTRARQNELASALSKHFGEKLQVDIQVGQPVIETPMQEKARLDDERREAARESLEADPNVRALKDIFGAELNPDSIELVGDGQRGQQNRSDR